MSSKIKLGIDFGVWIGFLVATEPRLTGIAVHEWFSLALGAALLTHVLLHWSWIVALVTRFFQKLWHVSRLKFVLDILLFVAFITIFLSGVMISQAILPALGIRLAENGAWKFIHGQSVNAALVLIGLHIALNWKGLVNTVSRWIVAPLRPRRLPAIVLPNNVEAVPVRVEEQR